MADIQFQDNTFFIGDKENPDAALTFRRKDDQTIIADHTFVDEKLRGQGVAGQLFQALITYARREHLSIIPECSYVQKKMERTSEYNDVLAKLM